MSSEIILKPLDPQQDPFIQQKYAFFAPEESLPPQVMIAIKNSEAAKIDAKKAAIFFNERREQIVGVSVSSDGYLSKVYTISQEGIRRIWGKKLGKEGLFFPYIEMKPRPNTKPLALSQPPSSLVD